MTPARFVGRNWIDRLPDVLRQQADVLARLYDIAYADLRIRAFSLAGSVARGHGDSLSDLDTRVWISDDEFDEAINELPAIARAVGETEDILFETPGSPFLFIQYADGVQVELLAVRTSAIGEGVPRQVVLFDRDGLLRDAPEPPSPWDVGLWTGWAAMRLYDLDKYLRRYETWRAFIQLQEIRNLLLRHHAAKAGLPDPELGLVSIRDYDGTLPPGLENTVANLDPADIRRAAVACAELLAASERRPFTDLVLRRLRSGA
jgi:hypothetical protein